MLHLEVVHAVPLNDRVGEVQNFEGPLRVIRMRGALNDGVKTETHDCDAVQFGLVRALCPSVRRPGSYGGTDQKLPSLHLTYLFSQGWKLPVVLRVYTRHRYSVAEQRRQTI